MLTNPTEVPPGIFGTFIMKSASLAWCRRQKHPLIRHSPDGFNMILECPECCIAWKVMGVTGEEIRLYGEYELRLTRQKYEPKS